MFVFSYANRERERERERKIRYRLIDELFYNPIGILSEDGQKSILLFIYLLFKFEIIKKGIYFCESVHFKFKKKKKVKLLHKPDKKRILKNKNIYKPEEWISFFFSCFNYTTIFEAGIFLFLFNEIVHFKK